MADKNTREPLDPVIYMGPHFELVPKEKAVQARIIQIRRSDQSIIESVVPVKDGKLVTPFKAVIDE